MDHDVWLLTRKNNASAIEAALEAEPHLSVRGVYIDLPTWARWWKRGGHGVHLYYLLWQVRARRVARRLASEQRFDVAHHVTFAMDWMPAAVVGIRRLPAVWGPVGGATSVPWSQWRSLGVRGLVSEAVREVVTRLMRMMFGDRTARNAALVIAQNNDVKRRFAYREVVVEPNVAVSLPQARFSSDTENEVDQLTAVFAGRLVPWKGVAIALRAVALVQRSVLHVYGDGPDRRRLEMLAQKLGLSERAIFHGHRPRSDVLSSMAKADVFLFLSLHDSAPWALGEAVTLGLPSICVDNGGPGVLIGDHSPSVALNPSRRMHEAVAVQLRTLTGAKSPSSRWSEERLPALLERWYAQAISGQAAYR